MALDLYRSEHEGDGDSYCGVPLCCVLGICSGSVDFFVLNLNRKCWQICSVLKEEGVLFQ